MTETITDTGGLYWLQHSPPKALLRNVIGTHKTLAEHLASASARFKSLFGATRSAARMEQHSALVVGSAGARCVSPCLQRLPRHTRRLVVVAR